MSYCIRMHKDSMFGKTVSFNTWAVEACQQVAVGCLVGQSGERRCCRGELGQLGPKVTRKRGSSFTEKEKMSKYK